MLVGYARTSTTDQQAGLQAQERDLKAAGCEKVFSEQVSSVAQRDKLQACLDFVREGDAVVVTKPDRLARSTADLLAIEADLSRRGVGLVILSMGGECLDTRNPTSKLILTILAYMAYQNIWHGPGSRRVRITGPLDPENMAKRDAASAEGLDA